MKKLEILDCANGAVLFDAGFILLCDKITDFLKKISYNKGTTKQTEEFMMNNHLQFYICEHCGNLVVLRMGGVAQSCRHLPD